MNERCPELLKRRDFIATAVGVAALAPALARARDSTQPAHSNIGHARPPAADSMATGPCNTVTMLGLIRGAQAIARWRSDHADV